MAQIGNSKVGDVLDLAPAAGRPAEPCEVVKIGAHGERTCKVKSTGATFLLDETGAFLTREYARSSVNLHALSRALSTGHFERPPVKMGWSESGTWKEQYLAAKDEWQKARAKMDAAPQYSPEWRKAGDEVEFWGNKMAFFEAAASRAGEQLSAVPQAK